MLTRLWLARHVQNQSRITLMRRICSFHGFLLCLAGFLCACRALGLSRIISCWRLSSAVKAQIQSERNQISSGNVRLNEIREKMKSVASVLSVNSLSACGLNRRRRSTTMWYCLPDSLSLLVCNPETASRVTLDSLGIGFQPNLIATLHGNHK